MRIEFKIISKQNSVILALVLFVGCSLLSVDQSDLENQARGITRQFTAALLPTLQEALAEGGPVEAIEVCSIRAPEIAAELAAATSWSVRRVSLRARNSEKAIPDHWERRTLEQFEDQQRGGAMGNELNQSAVFDGEFRYMQAQLAMPVCLTCHGTDLHEDVSSALHKYYPDDLAVGYAQGDVRGAISLRYPID